MSDRKYLVAILLTEPKGLLHKGKLSSISFLLDFISHNIWFQGWEQ